MSAGSPTSRALEPRPGAKRSGDDSVNTEQPLAKRFHLLNLDNNEEGLWVPMNSNKDVSAKYVRKSEPTMGEGSTPMHIDDTKTKVYVHNLDEELEQADNMSNVDRVVFLPDIERKVNKIPNQVLSGTGRPRVAGNELILYSVPRSLNLPSEQDSVRKAILESRARARGRSGIQTSSNNSTYEPKAPATEHLQLALETVTETDADAMELG